jgi:hypothetical protein
MTGKIRLAMRRKIFHRQAIVDRGDFDIPIQPGFHRKIRWVDEITAVMAGSILPIVPFTPRKVLQRIFLIDSIGVLLL